MSAGIGSEAIHLALSKQNIGSQDIGQGLGSRASWSAAVAYSISAVMVRVGAAAGGGVKGPQGWEFPWGMGIPQGHVPSVETVQSILVWVASWGKRNSAPVATMATRRAKRQ